MNITAILIAAAVVGITGLIIGLFLGVSADKFYVPVDEKELAIRDLLPGNNCGGCGFAGCDALAKAIAQGEAAPDACPVGGDAVSQGISDVMGVSGGGAVKMTAFVKCAGTCEKAKTQYQYTGLLDCTAAASAPGQGPKACSYGCTGFGSCVSACPFDAIYIVDGIAVVDKDACKACSKCIIACPKNLIELVPYKQKHLVQCNSKDKGKDVKAVCQSGCIGCGICAKNCEADAITVENNIAHIDPDKCTNCGVCVAKCPVKIIV